MKQRSAIIVGVLVFGIAVLLWVGVKVYDMTGVGTLAGLRAGFDDWPEVRLASLDYFDDGPDLKIVGVHFEITGRPGSHIYVDAPAAGAVDHADEILLSRIGQWRFSGVGRGYIRQYSIDTGAHVMDTLTSRNSFDVGVNSQVPEFAALGMKSLRDVVSNYDRIVEIMSEWATKWPEGRDIEMNGIVYKVDVLPAEQ